MMDQRRKERRIYPRVKTNLALEIDDGGLIIKSRVENISSSGVYCQLEKPILAMSKVMVSLFLPHPDGQKVGFDQVKCQGVVARSEPIIKRDSIVYSAAIYFSDITKKDKNKIVNFILRNL